MTAKRRVPPQVLIATAVSICSWPGWLVGAPVDLWWELYGRPSSWHRAIAYLAICIGTAATSVASVFVKEVRDAMRAACVTPSEIRRGSWMALLLGSVGVVATWSSVGFKGPFMVAPVGALWLGAWLAARHHAIGRSRSVSVETRGSPGVSEAPDNNRMQRTSGAGDSNAAHR
jgi:hypothetical protein